MNHKTMKLCLDCPHCWVDYDGGYSEYTPGEGLTFKCSKGHFDVGNNIDKNTIKSCILKAETCLDFKP